MKSPKRRRQDLRALCAETYEDDGIDPRHAFTRESSTRHEEHRKTRQLCRQVARSLEWALSGSCADDRLRELEIVEVSPAPDSTHFRVLLRRTGQLNPADAERLRDQLNLARGFLRSQIALDISRKRVPDLTFEFVDGTP